MSSPLAEQLQRLRSAILSARPAGVITTGVPGVSLFWNERPVPRSPLLYSAGLVFVAQGRKVGYLGGRRFEYDADTCLVLGAPVPFECEVQVDDGEPLLGFRIDIDPTMLHGLLARFAGGLTFDAPEGSPARSGVEPLRLDGALHAATVRLFECLNVKAKELLVFEGLRVSEAAFEVGHGSASQLSRDFKRYFSVPPSEADALPYSDAG